MDIPVKLDFEILVISRIPRPDGRIDLTYHRSDAPDDQNEVIIGAPCHLESAEDILGYVGAYAAINARVTPEGI